MKRGYKLLFALIAALMLLFTTSALAETFRFGTVSNSNSVNLRASTSTKSERLGSYKRNTWLRVTGEVGDWYKVTGPDGKSGYMMKQYVYINAGAKGIIGITDVAKSLNLRSKPSYSGQIVGTYGNGVPCILLSESGDWYHVTVDGKAGYFNSAYVQKKYMTYASDLATVTVGGNGSVKLRQGPGTSYSSIKTLRNGTIVMVIQTGDNWWKVSAAGTVGFISTDYLKDGVYVSPSSDSSYGNSGASSAGTTTAAVYLSNRSSRLHLRVSASSKSPSLGTYPHGTQVTVLARASNWCRVRIGSLEGYMATDYLRFGYTGDANSGGSGSSSGSNSNEPAIGYAQVRMSSASSKLHLRERASTSSRSLGTYLHGTMVEVISKGSSWTRVRIGNQVGYMATRYLSFNGLNNTSTATVIHPQGTYVNLRRGESTDTSVLVRVPHGAQVEVLAYGSTWCQVEYRGYVGYMMTRFLQR